MLRFERAINNGWGMVAAASRHANSSRHCYIMPNADRIVIDGNYSYGELEEIYLKAKEVKENGV